jgi:hypothetical protein
MRGARTRLFHAIVGLGIGVTAGVACGSTVEQSDATTGGTGGSGGAGGAATTTSSGGAGGAVTTATASSSSSSGVITFDAGPPSDAQTWDVVPIK